MKAMVYDGFSLAVKEVTGDSYDFLRNTVDGYIEHIPVDSLGSIDMWGNEEAKLIGLSPTIALAYKGKIYDVVCGTVVFMRHDGKGNTIGLKDKDIKFLKKKFGDEGIAFTNYGVLQIMNF